MNTTPINKLSPSLPANIDVQKVARAKEAAKQFEAFFVSRMLEVMTKNINTSGLVEDNSAIKAFNSMYMDELAKNIAGSGSFGIKNAVFYDLMRRQPGMENVTKSKIMDLKSSSILINKDVSFSPFSVQSERNRNADNRKILPHIEQIVEKASQKYGVRESLIMAVIKAESGFDPYAVSPKGAKGLMQIMDATAKDLGVKNVWSIYDNIMGGTRYLSQLIRRFSDETLGLAAYNAGQGNVVRHNGVPPFNETVNYIRRVREYEKIYRR